MAEDKVILLLVKFTKPFLTRFLFNSMYGSLQNNQFVSSEYVAN